MIAHSFKEGGNFDTSSGEVNMAARFRTLGQKKSKLVVNPLAVSVPSIILELLPSPTPVLTLTVQEVAKLNLLEAPLLD